MPRPLKTDPEALICRLPMVRCSASQLATIAERASKAGLTQSAYLREMALHGKVQVKQVATDPALVEQWRRVGVNLNQLTHAAHLGQATAPELAALLSRIEGLLDEAMP